MATEQEIEVAEDSNLEQNIYEKIKHGKIRRYKYPNKRARNYARTERTRIVAQTLYQETPENFKFHSKWRDSQDTVIHNIKIPDEIIILIFLNISPQSLLDYSLVCKRWCNIIKSTYVWRRLFELYEYPKRAPRLPWYVFYSYFTTNNYENMIRPDLQEEFNNSYGLDGGDRIPDDVDYSHVNLDENGNPTLDCSVWVNMRVCLGKKRLLQYIIRRFRPTIYLSEIVQRGLERRADYHHGNEYQLWFHGYREPVRYFKYFGGVPVASFKTSGGKCLTPVEGDLYTEKAELIVTNYCPRLKHLCMIRQYYSVAGVKCIQSDPLMKIVFDSITKKKRRSREKRSINWLGNGWNW